MEPVPPPTVNTPTLIASTPLPSPSPSHNPYTITSWADQVEADEHKKTSRPYNNNKDQQSNKRRRFQLHPQKQQPKSQQNYQHKEKERKKHQLIAKSTPSAPSNNQQITENAIIQPSSTDSPVNASSDPLPPSTSAEKGKKVRKNKNKRKRRGDNAGEEGKKVFIGGISFEDCGYTLSNDNQTLAFMRTQKFSQIFYNFGKVKRIQGHWHAGYCFVVYSKRRDAKQAVRYLSMYNVRKRIVKDLKDTVAAQGVLPLPSFYVRWPTDKRSQQPSSAQDSQMKVEDMLEEDVEKLLRDLKLSREREDEDDDDEEGEDYMEQESTTPREAVPLCRNM